MPLSYKRGQLSKALMFWGCFVFVIFFIFLTAGKFEMWNRSAHGRENVKIISRHDDPLIFWGIESAILVLAVSLVAAGVYRARKDSGSGDA